MVFGFRRFKKPIVSEVTKSSKDEIKSALQTTEVTVSTLSKRQLDLESRIKKCIEEAKEKASTDKAGALAALRRKKLYEEEIKRIAASILTLESQSITLEGAHMQHMALSALSSGLAAQKKIQQSMAANKIDDLMDELEEQREAQMEVFDAMTQGVASTVEFEDELNELLADGGKEEVKVDANIDDELKNLEKMLDKLTPSETVPQIKERTSQKANEL